MSAPVASMASPRSVAFADTNCTIFLCPKPSCRLFEDTSGPVPCENDCPCPSRMRKAIVCRGCKTLIKLPADHFSFCRVDCPKCGVMNMQRMSSRYRRVNQ